MKIPKIQVKQRGFFGIGIALGLSALFGATTATVVTLDKQEKQETAAMQQKEAPQRQAATVLEQPVTANVDKVTADIR